MWKAPFVMEAVTREGAHLAEFQKTLRGRAAEVGILKGTTPVSTCHEWTHLFFPPLETYPKSRDIQSMD